MQTVDADLESDPPYLVSNFIAGVPWKVFLDDPSQLRVPGAIALAMLADLFEVLAYLHTASTEERGVLLRAHRDVSPQNLVLGFDGTTRLIDLGLAKTNSHTQLTHVNSAMGTLRYMAPEVASASHTRVGPATDIYSACAMAYELLSGSAFRPRHLSMPELLERAKQGTVGPPPATDPADAGVWSILFRGLSLRTMHRYASAEEVRQSLGAARPAATAAEVAAWVGAQYPDEVVRQRELVERARVQGLSFAPVSGPREQSATRVVARASLQPTPHGPDAPLTAVVRLRGAVTEDELPAQSGAGPVVVAPPVTWSDVGNADGLSEDSLVMVMAWRRQEYFAAPDEAVAGLPVGVTGKPAASHAGPAQPSNAIRRAWMPRSPLGLAAWTAGCIVVTVATTLAVVGPRDGKGDPSGEGQPSAGAERADDAARAAELRPTVEAPRAVQGPSTDGGVAARSEDARPSLVTASAPGTRAPSPAPLDAGRVELARAPSEVRGDARTRPDRPSAGPRQSVEAGPPPTASGATTLRALASQAASDVEARRTLLDRARAAIARLPEDRRQAVSEKYQRASLRGADEAAFQALVDGLVEAGAL